MLPFPAVIIGTDILRQSGIVRRRTGNFDLPFATRFARGLGRNQIPSCGSRTSRSQEDILIFNNRLSCVRELYREERLLNPREGREPDKIANNPAIVL